MVSSTSPIFTANTLPIVQDKSATTAAGLPPPDFAAVTAVATDRTVRHLAAKLKKYEDGKDGGRDNGRDGDGDDDGGYSNSARKRRRRNNNNSGGFRGGRGGFRGGRGGGGRGGYGRGGDGGRRSSPHTRKDEYCFKFNDKKGCSAAKTGTLLELCPHRPLT